MEESNLIEEMDGIIQEALEQPKGAESALDILGLAIKIEELSKEHYEYMANKVENPTGKSMFKYLASEEAEHVKTLGVQYDALKSGSKLESEKGAPIQNICPLIHPKKDPKVSEDIVPDESSVSRDATDKDALKLAIEVKKRAIKFYCTAASKVDDHGKKMFAHLIDVENRHLNELGVQYAWLEQAGFWYDHNMMTD